MTVFVKDWDVATAKQDKVEVRAVTIQMILPAAIPMMTVVTPMLNVVATQEFLVVMTVVHQAQMGVMVIRQVHPRDQRMIVMVSISQVSVASVETAAEQVVEELILEANGSRVLVVCSVVNATTENSWCRGMTKTSIQIRGHRNYAREPLAQILASCLSVQRLNLLDHVVVPIGLYSVQATSNTEAMLLIVKLV